jgi:hypothetical protein
VTAVAGERAPTYVRPARCSIGATQMPIDELGAVTVRVRAAIGCAVVARLSQETRRHSVEYDLGGQGTIDVPGKQRAFWHQVASRTLDFAAIAAAEDVASMRAHGRQLWIRVAGQVRGWSGALGIAMTCRAVARDR